PGITPVAPPASGLSPSSVEAGLSPASTTLLDTSGPVDNGAAQDKRASSVPGDFGRVTESGGRCPAIGTDARRSSPVTWFRSAWPSPGLRRRWLPSPGETLQQE